MIIIDKDSTTPPFEQLVEQLRFQLASGKYKKGDVLPSTRELAKQIDISFHTVRKAYQVLETEGLVSSKVGSGYSVNQRPISNKEELMEKGAGIIQESLQKLIGIGLKEADIEYLFQEQLAFFDNPALESKVLFTAPYLELAESCAKLIATQLQTSIHPVAINHLKHHKDADYVITPFVNLHEIRTIFPNAEVVGISVYHNPEALEEISKLLSNHTLGLVTRHGHAISPIMQQIKKETGFTGQIMAASTELQHRNAIDMLAHADLIVYTPQSGRKVKTMFPNTPSVSFTPFITSESLAIVLEKIPK